ncbi:hypothetical protein [Helicobacter sp. 11S02596-1]|uniref:hypothetical protein n=1 Tax=Helicobacter sp. 11S02596-1 TaxID=1476194 RepID=UPI001C5D4536|nr:hypothetical protein [Helicobacter sp. 11S02596-1]
MKTIKKFRKKPIVVEAYQTDKEVIIPTLEGDMKANIGDWIITGVKGEQYPCKPDVFEKTYEPQNISLGLPCKPEDRSRRAKPAFAPKG